MDNQIEKNTLKVTATYKVLDYKGEVKTTEVVKEIPWSVDSKEIIEHTIRHGSMKGFRKPFVGYYNDLMKKYFNVEDHDKVWRPVKVESETLSCGAKFVFQRRNEHVQVMEWEDVANGQ